MVPVLLSAKKINSNFFSDRKTSSIQTSFIVHYNKFKSQRSMQSPKIKQSSSLKSLTDSQINTDMSDLQQNQQKHQETVRRFSILSGIEDELNRKLDQKPMNSNSIIIEEDEEQSIRKSKENENHGNTMGSHATVSDYVTSNQKYGGKHQESSGQSGHKNEYSSYRYKPKVDNQEKKFEMPKMKEITVVKEMPIARMYRVSRTINLLGAAPPIVQHPKAFHQQQAVGDSFEDAELFGMALNTQRIQQQLQMNKH